MTMRCVVFAIDSASYAIAADKVLEIVRAVAVTPFPGSPATVLGIIDVRGTIVPVFDMRRRFRLPDRAVAPEDHFIIVSTSARTAALHVDTVLDIADVDAQQIADLSTEVSAVPAIDGVASLPDGLVLIHDVDKFLSRTEADALDKALAAADSAAP